MELTRGDTMWLKFQRKDLDGNPILEKASNIYFSVKQNNHIKDVVFQKTIGDMEFDEEGYYHFIIEPDDTNALYYGNYTYDLEVKEDEYVKTIAKGILTLTEETTHKNNEV